MKYFIITTRNSEIFLSKECVLEEMFYNELIFRKKKNMELREFISETIIQIMEGIIDAQEAVANKNGLVNPKRLGNTPGDTPMAVVVDEYTKGVNRRIEIIDFEVALTEVEKSDKKVGIGVGFSNITMGSERKKGGENTSFTTVKFSIPVVFPCQSQGESHS